MGRVKTPRAIRLQTTAPLAVPRGAKLQPPFPRLPPLSLAHDLLHPLHHRLHAAKLVGMGGRVRSVQKRWEADEEAGERADSAGDRVGQMKRLKKRQVSGAGSGAGERGR